MRHLSAAIVVLLGWVATCSAQSVTLRPDDTAKAEEEIARIVGYAMTRGGASAFLVSRRTIQNAVHSVTGKTFRDLRGEILLARIKNLLASAPNSAIRKVSLEAGYRSPRAFARAVRRACGVSPQQLRTRIAKELLASKVPRRFRKLRAANTRAIQK